MGKIPSSTDVVVIGGGPAGSAAATQLARDGFDVVLLEKARHPRPSVGESLIPHFWRFTDMLGATAAVEAEGFLEKSGGLVLWDDRFRQIRFRDFGYTRPGLHVERDRLDLILLRNAEQHGARIFEETAVTSVDGDLARPVVKYRRAGSDPGEIRPRYVVDGSGQSAVIARALGTRRFDPDIRFTAMWGYYTGGRYLTIDGDVEPFSRQREIAPCTLVAAIGDWGWVWHIILRDSVSIGVILPPARLRAFKSAGATREARFQALVAQAPIVGDLMRDAQFTGEMYAIRDYSYLPVRLAEGSCYLVGDAAAFVDPINSAGVVFGLYGGVLAAWSIGRALHSPQRADEVRQMFCEMYADRIAMLRLMAMPADAAGVAAAIEEARRGVAMSSDAERRLMLMQATLNARPGGIIRAFEQLGVSTECTARDMPIPKVA